MSRAQILLGSAICGLAVAFLAFAPAAHAGRIDLSAAAVIVSGPGLGNVALPVAITPDPNNDNQPGGPGGDNNITVPIKRFDSNGYIDIVFPTSNTDGVTEYVVFENVDNNTGVDWAMFTVELGFGFNSGFTPSTAGDGLDFDAPGYDPSSSFFSDAFANVQTTEDKLTFSGGLQGAGSENYGFRIDVPDDLGVEGFTIRQTPVPVPEPSSLLLVALCSLVLGVIFRR
jgi:hypothetical protein